MPRRRTQSSILVALHVGAAAFAGSLGLGCAGTGTTGVGATGGVPGPRVEPRTCPGGFDASFVQLGRRELRYQEQDWRRKLAVLRAVGVSLIVVQYTGDQGGPYDGRAGRAPVRALLDAAGAADMRVFVGLYSDPTWPAEAAASRLPPPLGDAPREEALVDLCAGSRACAGWYVPQEIDDTTWSSPARTAHLRAFLSRTAAELRRVSPGRPIAIAPFFTGALEPADHARWWDSLLADQSIDILILQDGIGSGRTTAEVAAWYLTHLRQVASARGVDLWSVAELFRQVHGLPVDQRPFQAVPMHPATLRRDLIAERAHADRIVAFTVLDYMDPARSHAARRLYEDYASACEIACNPKWGQPCR